MRNQTPKKRDPLDACPAELALSFVSKKWTSRILYILSQGPMNFAGFLKLLPEISEEVLAARIADLNEGGLIEKKEGWILTSKGKALTIALGGLAQWGMNELSSKGMTWNPPIFERPLFNR